MLCLKFKIYQKINNLNTKYSICKLMKYTVKKYKKLIK